MQQRPAIARVLAREPPKSQAAAGSAFSCVHTIVTDRLASLRSPHRQQSPGLATLVSPAIMSAVGAFAMSAHTQLSQQDQWKKDAGEAAAKLVEDGMVVGLGTGSTATFAVAALGRRVKQDGLRIVGIPTSERTAEQANAVGIPLTTFAEHTQIDLTIDGADEVLPGLLYLIKGHGGALLREKIVAAASKRMAVVADDTKLVKRLGELVSVPVEVVPFGWQVTAERLRDLGGNP